MAIVRSAGLALGALLLSTAGAQPADPGKRQYEARCVGCHGADGSGGGHGPAIVDVRRPRASSAEAVRDLILKGIPEGGMPAFPMAEPEAAAIAAYVMKLKSPVAAIPAAADGAPGDAAAGERFFNGPGNCANCHMVRGQGGILGPDLSTVGRDRRPTQIEQALRDPGAAPAQGGRGGRGGRGAPVYRAVTVKLRNGQTLRGIAKNESPFDLQLLGTDNRLHLLRKEEIAAIDREKSLMPKVAASPAELRDLVAYLSRLGAEAERQSHAVRRPAGRRRALRRRGPSPAGRMAHLRRQPERQPLQPAQPDRHRQRGAPGARSGCSPFRERRAPSKARPWWSTA